MTASEAGSRRARTVSWEDPKVSKRDAAAISGLDYLCGIRDGRIEQPPVAKLLGYRLREVERGRAVWDFIGVSSRPFVTLRVDVRRSGDPTRKVIEEIARHDLQDAIVRVIVTAPPDELSVQFGLGL